MWLLLGSYLSHKPCPGDVADYYYVSYNGVPEYRRYRKNKSWQGDYLQDKEPQTHRQVGAKEEREQEAVEKRERTWVAWHELGGKLVVTVGESGF